MTDQGPVSYAKKPLSDEELGRIARDNFMQRGAGFIEAAIAVRAAVEAEWAEEREGLQGQNRTLETLCSEYREERDKAHAEIEWLKERVASEEKSNEIRNRFDAEIKQILEDALGVDFRPNHLTTTSIMQIADCRDRCIRERDALRAELDRMKTHMANSPRPDVYDAVVRERDTLREDLLGIRREVGLLGIDDNASIPTIDRVKKVVTWWRKEQKDNKELRDELVDMEKQCEDLKALLEIARGERDVAHTKLAEAEAENTEWEKQREEQMAREGELREKLAEFEGLQAAHDRLCDSNAKLINDYKALREQRSTRAVIDVPPGVPSAEWLREQIEWATYEVDRGEDLLGCYQSIMDRLAPFLAAPVDPPAAVETLDELGKVMYEALDSKTRLSNTFKFITWETLTDESKQEYINVVAAILNAAGAEIVAGTNDVNAHLIGNNFSTVDMATLGVIIKFLNSRIRFRVKPAPQSTPIATAETLEQLAEVLKSKCGSLSFWSEREYWEEGVTAILNAAGAYVSATSTEIGQNAVHEHSRDFHNWLNSRIRFRVAAPQESYPALPIIDDRWDYEETKRRVDAYTGSDIPMGAISYLVGWISAGNGITQPAPKEPEEVAGAKQSLVGNKLLRQQLAFDYWYLKRRNDGFEHDSAMISAGRHVARLAELDAALEEE